MVETVLASLEKELEQIVEDVQSEGDALMPLQQMCNRLSKAYEQRQKAYVLAALMLGSAEDVFQKRVQTLL